MMWLKIFIGRGIFKIAGEHKAANEGGGDRQEIWIWNYDDIWLRKELLVTRNIIEKEEEMNKSVCKVLAIVTSCAVIMGFAGTLCAAKKPILIRLSESSPPKGFRADAINWAKERIEKQTEGNVRFELYWSSSLLKIKEKVRGVSRGTADMAFMYAGKYPKEFPVWGALNSVVIGPKDGRRVAALDVKLLDKVPAFNADFAKWNLKILGFHVTTGFCLFMTKPLDTIDSLKNMKVRAPDLAHLTMIKVIGGAPLFMPMSECYTGMQRGTIDGVFSSLESGHRYKFHEVAKEIYPCLPVWGSIPNVAVINVDTWNSIPEKDQKIVGKIFRDMGSYVADIQEKGLAKMRADFKEAGCAVNDIPEQELLRWSRMPGIPELQEAWVEKANKLGYPGDQILGTVKDLVAEEMK